MKTIIVDDERRMRMSIKRLVELECPELEIAGEADGVKNALELLKSIQPDLIFLDIRLKDGTGFQLLDEIPNPNFQVIFITAFDEFAVKAFHYNAIHYLLKPIVVSDLKMAVERVFAKGVHPTKEIWNKLHSDVNAKRLDMLALPTQTGFKTVEPKDILRCQSDNYYTLFYFRNGAKLIVSKTLKYYDEILTPHHFLRVHQSHLVNLSEVTEYRKHYGGMVVLSNQEEIPVSNNRKEMLFSHLNYR